MTECQLWVGLNPGIQAWIKVKQPKAVYTHCSGHALNLSFVGSCSIPSVRNCIDSIKNLTIRVKYSTKREGLLKAITSQVTHPTSWSPRFNVCITRWVENIDGWECFTHADPILVKMCEIIRYGGSDFLPYCDGWTADYKKNALAHLKCQESFEFIYCVIRAIPLLCVLKGSCCHDSR